MIYHFRGEDLWEGARKATVFIKQRLEMEENKAAVTTSSLPDADEAVRRINVISIRRREESAGKRAFMWENTRDEEREVKEKNGDKFNH